MRHSPAALASVALLLTAAPAFATVRTFNAVMNGAQEPTPSGGTGTATVTIDDVSGLTTVNGAFTGLTSPANNAHLHGLAAPGSPAPALFTPTFTPATSGTVSGSGTLTGANLAGALAGLTYINIHSVNFTGGEIRGQVLAVAAAPAVPTWGIGLLTLSIASLGAWLISCRRVISAGA
jgi:hypothetical protein